MPKKNLLISAALTAFILVVATGIVSAYQRVNATLDATKVGANADAARVDEVQPVVDAVSLPDQVLITHQEAALVATNYFGQTDLYSVENVVWEGVDAYEVVFSSGDSVYVSMTGEVLGTEAPEPVVIIEEVPAASETTSASSSSSATSVSSYYDDDDHDDHSEDYDDDYDDDHDEKDEKDEKDEEDDDEEDDD